MASGKTSIPILILRQLIRVFFMSSKSIKQPCLISNAKPDDFTHAQWNRLKKMEFCKTNQKMCLMTWACALFFSCVKHPVAWFEKWVIANYCADEKPSICHSFMLQGNPDEVITLQTRTWWPSCAPWNHTARYRLVGCIIQKI